MSEFERVSIGLNILTLCITAAAIGVAAEQLNSWRKELTGSERYRVAMRLHVSLLKLELAISQARAIATLGSFAQKSQTSSFGDLRDDLERRWAFVNEALEELRPLKLEAKVFLNSEIDALIDALLGRVVDLRLAFNKFLAAESWVFMPPDVGAYEMDMVYGAGTADDKFAQEIRERILTIETNLAQFSP